MTERDDRLAAELQDYYRRMAQEPAPDVMGRVMMSTDLRTRRIRRWSAIGGGLLAAGVVAAVVVVALAYHGSPTGVAPAHSPTPQPSTTPTPALPTDTIVPVGPPAHGIAPTDVTAVSSNEWWVLGYLSLTSCPAGPPCPRPLRIVHTTDDGHTFVSIPVPPLEAAQASQPADRLRFADPLDGWLVSGAGAVWETHDGGAHWAKDSSAGSVTDLEASGGAVYAVTCVGTPGCIVERSATGQDSWTSLSASAGHGNLNRLNVNGAHIWVAIESQAGGLGWLLASTDSGQHFTMQTACPGALGFANLYAVSSSMLWATCATGTEASAFRSVDGGRQFTQVAGQLSLPNFASIAGVSSTTAVIAGQGLQRTVDGGQTFATVENAGQWTIVGFTTSVNGFAFDDVQGIGQSQLWRTNDAGAHWFRVQFP